MNVAIDVSPIEGKGSLHHRVRGTGSYVKSLKESLLKYYPNDKYTFFTRGQTLPAGRQELPKDVDLIHYPYFEPFFLTLPFSSKTPFIVTVHDLTPLVFPKYFPAGLRGSLKWKIQRTNLKKAKRIITDSISSKNDIIKYAGIPEDRIEVIYLAAGEELKVIHNSEFIIHNLRKKFHLPEKFALYVGDVTWNKNLPRLIEACLKANIPLVLTGEAFMSSDFDRKNPWNQDLAIVQEISKENKNIIRIGFVSDDDLTSLYNMAAVFVMPSLYEGFGLPILEAMSCGCPVITSKEGSLPEVAGNAAFYVDAYSIDSISEGIIKVFSNADLRKELSEKGIKQAQKFSWKKTAEKTIKVYEKVLEF